MAKQNPKPSTNSDQKPPNLRMLIKDSTIKSYKAELANMYAAAQKKRGLEGSEQVTAKDLIDDFVESIPTGTRGLLLFRKSVLGWWFSQWTEKVSEVNEAMARLVKAREDIRLTSKTGTETRRKSGRNIPTRDLNKLLNFLADNPGNDAKSGFGRWGLKIEAYIRATLGSGLRPNEWINASWDNPEKSKLRVKSSKQTLIPPGWKSYTTIGESSQSSESVRFKKKDLNNAHWLAGVRNEDGALNLEPVDDEYESAIKSIGDGLTDEELATLRQWRRHSVKKEVRIIHIDPEHVEAISRHMDFLNDFISKKISDSFKLNTREKVGHWYYDMARQLLRRACLNTFPDGRTYSLYDLRSKFSSNTKAIYGAQVAVEALGHNNDRTIGKSYGYISDATPEAKQKGRARRVALRQELGLPMKLFPHKKEIIKESNESQK